MTQNYFFSDLEKNLIKSIAYLDKNHVLFAFEGEENLNIFNYSEGNIIS